MKHGVLALAAVLSLGACGGPATPPAWNVPMSDDACAADGPWLLAVLGERPDKSNSIHVDRASRDPTLGPAIAVGGGREMDGDSLLLRNVTWASQESYEYEQGDRTHVVIVARGVTGKDPRTLGELGAPPTFGEPITLPSGVREYPPNASPPVAGRERKALFVFPDRTWVIVEEWMEPRFRATFEHTVGSPPLPHGPADVYVEYCMPKVNTRRSHDDGSKTGGLLLTAPHQTMRFRFGLLPGYELVETFDTPHQAADALAAQRARCDRQPCRVASYAADGRTLRYVVR